jgi:cytochrome oxidase Cu insertion factor (SCO1/SenC/PrrC family)
VTTEKTKAEIRKSNRLTLMLIFGIPVTVLLFSTVLYYLADARVVDLGQSNKGKLLTPPVQLKDLPLKNTDGSDFNYEKPEPKWAFLMIGGETCQENCQGIMTFMRQAHQASGAYVVDIRRIYLNVDESSSNQLRPLFEDENQGMTEAYVNKEKLLQSLAKVKFDVLGEKIFYLVDPRGWIMMHYTVDNFELATLSALSKDVNKDMKRLLQ